MLKGNRIYIFVLIAAIIILVVSSYLWSSKEEVWKQTYSSIEKKPFGTALVYQEIATLFTKKKIEKVGKRILKEDLNQIIIALCSIRPYSIEELTVLLNRNPKSFKNFNIKALLETKRLFYWIPEMIRHPQQKYVAEPSMVRSNNRNN